MGKAKSEKDDWHPTSIPRLSIQIDSSGHFPTAVSLLLNRPLPRLKQKKELKLGIKNSALGINNKLHCRHSSSSPPFTPPPRSEDSQVPIYCWVDRESFWEILNPRALASTSDERWNHSAKMPLYFVSRGAFPTFWSSVLRALPWAPIPICHAYCLRHNSMP